jgi:flagellar motor switch protein FliM
MNRISEMGPGREEVPKQSAQGQDTLRKKIARAATQAPRYPLLETIFDTFVARASITLRQLLGATTEVRFRGAINQSFGDFISSVEEPCILCIIDIPEWSDSALAVIDGQLLENIIEIMVGANIDAPLEYEARRPTNLDRDLVMRVIAHLLINLNECFHAAVPEIENISMRCARSETRPKFAAITPDPALVYVAHFNCEIGHGARSGRFDLVFPIAAFEPVRVHLQKPFRGENRCDDRIWMRHIANALLDTPATFLAEIAEQRMPVAEIQRWQLNDVIPLEVSDDMEIALFLETSREFGPLMKGRLGSWRGRKGIKITESLPCDFTAPMVELIDSMDDLIIQNTK